MFEATSRPKGASVRTRIATRTCLACAIALLSLSLAGTASADDDEAYDREGTYLGVHGVALFEDARRDLVGVADHSGGAGLELGFRLGPTVALELYGEWVRLQGVNPWTVGLNIKLYPAAMFEDVRFLDGRLQPFVIGSAGIQTGDFPRGPDPGANFRIGAGTDFYLTSDIALTGNVQYSGSGGDAGDLRSANIIFGALYRF